MTDVNPTPVDRPRIIVVGSSNTDLVVTVPKLPLPGETVLGGDMQTVAGGKGANQAVAAARLGGDVVFIGRVGADNFGRQALTNLQADGIDTQFLRFTAEAPSGVALISVDAQTGENSIVVAPGANSRVSAADIADSAAAFQSARAVVISLEIPLDAVEAAAALGRASGLTVILNPAPARVLPPSLLSMIDVITPNEQELEMLGRVQRLIDAGVKSVITTLGARGARLQSTTEDVSIPAPRVAAVDSVAAGDCFTGALAVSLARGSSLIDAIRYAIAAASLKVTRRGAQPGMPYAREVMVV